VGREREDEVREEVVVCRECVCFFVLSPFCLSFLLLSLSLSLSLNSPPAAWRRWSS